MLATATLALVVIMPAWRWVWAPVPLPETYPVTAEAFLTRVDAMTAAYATGEQTADGLAVVHPPPGDIYLAAQRFRFTPVLELEAGRTYHLHVTTVDDVHGFTFPLANIDLLLVPDLAVVVHLAPIADGRYTIQCSEYCGLDHSRMKGWVRVVGTVEH